MKVPNWSLKLDVEPDSPYNCKYMSHAVSLLHDQAVEIVVAELATQILNPKTGEGIELDESGTRYRKIDDSILGAEIVE